MCDQDLMTNERDYVELRLCYADICKTLTVRTLRPNGLDDFSMVV